MPRLAQLVEHLTVVGKNTAVCEGRHQGAPGSSPGAGTKVILHGNPVRN